MYLPVARQEGQVGRNASVALFRLSTLDRFMQSPHSHDLRPTHDMTSFSFDHDQSLRLYADPGCAKLHY